MKYGVIGSAGYWAQNLIKTLKSLNLEIAATCDFKNQELDGVKHFQDIDEFLKSDLDAVLISTPPLSHFEIAGKCLKAEKHIFCEKPFTMIYKDAGSLLSLAREKELIICVDNTFVYSPEVEFLKSSIRNNMFGRFLSFKSSRTNWGPHKTDVSVIMDLLPHDISILSELFWWPIEVSASGSSNINKGIIDDARVSFLFHNGLTAHVEISWISSSKKRSVEIVTDKGFINFEFGAGVIYFRDRGGKVSAFELSNYMTPLEIELNHFDYCIKNNKEPISNGSRAVYEMKILEKTVNSLNKYDRIESY